MKNLSKVIQRQRDKCVVQTNVSEDDERINYYFYPSTKCRDSNVAALI